MSNLTYQKICSQLLFGLNKRQKEVVSRRFGLKKEKRETLESIGKDFGICRERVRQIQKISLQKIRPKTKNYEKTFNYFVKHLRNCGDLKKEDILLEELGGKDQKNEVYFLLSLREPFLRCNENDSFYSLWTINKDSCLLAKKTIDALKNKLKKSKKPLSSESLSSCASLKKNALISYLETSKEIEKNQEGLYGLSSWPEINPRGVKDKAYLAFKKIGKPLHFSKLADLIEDSHIQTVHNELIKDDRFVLVGRGIYALSEWGYYPGQVKDIILKILKESDKPLTKENILDKVLKQRLVRKNTVLLNLSNKEYFLKDSEGRYTIKQA